MMTSEHDTPLLTLQAVARLGLLADDIQHRVDELGTLGVVALGPVVAGTSLPEDKVVRAEDLAIGARADGVHGTRLQIHQDGAGNVAACDWTRMSHQHGERSRAQNQNAQLTSSRFIEVDVDALQLEVGITMIGSGGVDSVLVRKDLPEERGIYQPE